MTSVTTNFDGGVVGQNIVAGSNGIQSVPDTFVPVFATGFHGNASVHAGGSANTADSRFRVDLGVGGDHMGSIYMRYNTPHASAGNFCIFMSWVNSANTLVASLRAGSARELNIRVGASTVVRTGSAGDIPNNTIFRFDWQVVGTTINWKMWYNPDADSGTTPDLSGTFTFSAATISRLVLGPTSSTALTKDLTYDTVRAQNDNTTWWNAFVPPSPPSTAFSIWDGATEVDCAVTIWNGSTEVPMDDWEIVP